MESSAAFPQMRVSFSTRSDMGIVRRRAHGISFELWRLSPREFPHTPTLASRLGIQRQPGHHGVVHCARHSIKASGGSTKKSITNLQIEFHGSQKHCIGFERFPSYCRGLTTLTLYTSRGSRRHRHLSLPSCHVSPKQQRGLRRP